MKKISLVLLAALGLTACNQTNKLPPSHYDKLADQPNIESYPLKADISALKQELLFERGVQAYLWALPFAQYLRYEGGFREGVRQRLQRPAYFQGASER